MNQNKSESMLDEEINNFILLEEKVDLVLKRMADLISERDLVLKQKSEMETLLHRREADVVELKERLQEAEKRAFNPEKAGIIKNKLTSLLKKLEEFE